MFNVEQKMNHLVDAGLLRLSQIIGQDEVTEEQAAENKKRNKGPKTVQPKITPLIPICKSAWWAGVRDGRYPQSVKLGPKTTAWRAEDIRKLLDEVGK
jgi:predicted DNA-binding transcriptional regulator AlpA